MDEKALPPKDENPKQPESEEEDDAHGEGLLRGLGFRVCALFYRYW